MESLTALYGAITGTLGVTLGVLNYLRDRSDVQVNVTWDLRTLPSDATGLPSNEPLVVVSVANLGRRPVFVSHAHLVLPSSDPDRRVVLVLTESVAGKTLKEGAPPALFYLPQKEVQKQSQLWKEARAVVQDSRGKRYCSRMADEHGIYGSIRYWFVCRRYKALYGNKPFA